MLVIFAISKFPLHNFTQTKCNYSIFINNKINKHAWLETRMLMSFFIILPVLELSILTQWFFHWDSPEIRMRILTCEIRNLVILSLSLPLGLERIISNMSPFCFSITTKILSGVSNIFSRFTTPGWCRFCNQSVRINFIKLFFILPPCSITFNIKFNISIFNQSLKIT